jgi:uncharacterized membrane protein
MLAGLYLRMALIGRFHPVLVHFPIALIVAAFGCELVSMATRLREWHVAAVANLRSIWIYRAALGAAAALVGVTGRRARLGRPFLSVVSGGADEITRSDAGLRGDRDADGGERGCDR